MIDFEVLKKFGTTNEALREIFTARQPSESEAALMNPEARRKLRRLLDIKEAWTKDIESRIHEGQVWNLNNYRLHAAVDMAMDAPPISKVLLPLLLYAQGRINITTCAKDLAGLPGSDQYLKKLPDGNYNIEVPRFVETSVNLVRSFVNRRLVTQTAKYNNLYPGYRYDPRSTSLKAALCGDAMSQRAEIWIDEYGVRHHDAQVMRGMFMYGHDVDFAASSWEIDRQWRRSAVTPGLEKKDDFSVEDVITREGVHFVNPHPTRVIWDMAHPLSSINSDTGCSYLAFWDMCRYRDIFQNQNYFNREHVTYSNNFWDMYAGHQAYFNQYLCAVKQPPSLQSIDPAAANDRIGNAGLYAQTMLDNSVFKTEYYERINPKAKGVGDYPWDVWVRLTVASDSTVVYAEIMPSRPAAYCGLNENDSRQVNCSFAHEVMWLQDQVSNLMTNLLMVIQRELLTVIGVNTDVLGATGATTAITDKNEGDAFACIKAQLGGVNWSTSPLVVPYSVRKLADLGIKADEVLKISQARGGQNIEQLIRAIAYLISIGEKLTNMSPNEQGQPAPRETTATENSEIASTTSIVNAGPSDGIDEFRAAKKRIFYESLMACAKQPLRVPLKGRYTKKAVESAGFRVDQEQDSDDIVMDRPAQYTITGSHLGLEHDYVFTSRDGSERPVSTQGANTLVQMLNVIFADPTRSVLMKMGKSKLYEIFNEIFRMSGAGVDLNLEIQPGEDDALGSDLISQLQQQIQQLMDALQQMADATRKNAEDLAQQDAVNQQQQALLQGVGDLAGLVKKSAQDIAAMQSAREDDIKWSGTIKYETAEPEIKAQIEQRLGFIPAAHRNDEAEKRGMEMALQAADADQKLRQGEEKHRLEMQAEQERIALESQKPALEMETKTAEISQKLRHRETEHRQKRRHAEEMAATKRAVTVAAAKTKTKTKTE